MHAKNFELIGDAYVLNYELNSYKYLNDLKPCTSGNTQLHNKISLSNGGIDELWIW